MQFTITIWRFTITFDLFDLDPSDNVISIGIYVRW